LFDYLDWKDNNEIYKGETTSKRTGRKPILSLDSEEAIIIANNIERGMSAPLVHLLVNKHRQEEELPSVTQSAIEKCIERMQAVKKSIKKRPQGSYDTGSRICRARYLWGLQFSVRTSLSCSQQAIEEYCKVYRAKHQKDDTFVPDYLRKDLLTLVHWTDIAFFDETHRKACPGSADKESVALLASKQFVYRVPRTNGKPDPEGTIDDYDVSQAYVKYTDEGRFCLGVTVDEVSDSNGAKQKLEKGYPCSIIQVGLF